MGGPAAASRGSSDGDDEASLQAMVAKARRFRFLTCPHMRTSARKVEERERLAAAKKARKGNKVAPASWAERAGEGSRMHIRNKRGKEFVYEPFPVCGFPARRFAHYGLGTHLYFRTLKWMAAFFVAASLLAAPALLFFAGGGHLEATYAVEVTMMGNLGSASNATDPSATIALVGAEVGRERMRSLLVWLDVALSVLYALVAVGLYRSVRRQKSEYDRNTLTVRQFTVRVERLPRDATRQSVGAFFEERYGEVVDVAMVRDNIDLVELYVLRGERQQRLSSATANGRAVEASRLRQMIDEVDGRIARLMRERESRRGRPLPVCAYVTFERQDSVARCRDDYPGTWLSRLTMPEERRMGGQRPLVSKAQEPSNILFHNLPHQGSGRCWRQLGSSLAAAAVLCVSFVAIYAALYRQRQLPEDGECPAGVTAAEAQADEDGALRDCYCKEQGVLASSRDDEVDCLDWLKAFALAKALVFATAVVVLVVNALLRYAVRRLGAWERHASRTEEQRAMTVKLFVGLFLNTAVVMLVADSPEDRARFVPDWYETVGLSIMLTMLTYTLNPHVWPLLRSCTGALRRRYAARLQATQDDMNNLFGGEEFLLWERYAVLLNILFVTLFYSAAMPLLLPSAAVAVSLTYLFDKVAFLRLYRIPARFDSSMASLMSSLMPYALVLHLPASIWFYTSPPLLEGGEDDDGGDGSGGGTAETITRYRDWPAPSRMTESYTLPLFTMFVILAALLVAHAVLRQLAGVLLCRGAACRRSYRRLSSVLDDRGVRGVPVGRGGKTVPLHKVTYSQAARRTRLASYQLSQQRHYRSAFVRTRSGRMLAREEPYAEVREGPPPGRDEEAPGRPRDEERGRAGAAVVMDLPNLSAAAAPPPSRGQADKAEIEQLRRHHRHHNSRKSLHRHHHRHHHQHQHGSSVSVASSSAQSGFAAEAAASPPEAMPGSGDGGGEVETHRFVYEWDPVTETTVRVVPIMCPVEQCGMPLRIVDAGEERVYSCPFCHSQFWM